LVILLDSTSYLLSVIFCAIRVYFMSVQDALK